MIRPLDLQNTILQSIQSAPAVQRADEAPRQAAQAAQAAFASEVTRRDEKVAATQEATGNRIGAKPERDRERPGDKKRRTITFDEVTGSLSDTVEEPPHLIDFTA